MNSDSNYYSPEKFYEPNITYIKFRDKFDEALSLYNASESLIRAINVRTRLSNEQNACSFIFYRSQEMLLSILKLCNIGLANDANIILRSLFDSYLQLKYIIAQDNGLLFLNFIWVALKNRYDTVYQFRPDILEKKEYRDSMELINDRFEKVKSDYRIKGGKRKGETRETWFACKRKQLAQSPGDEKAYDFIFKLCSASVHGDISTMFHFLRKYEEEAAVFDNSPDANDIEFSLLPAIEYFGRITTEWAIIMKAQIPDSFKRFLKGKV